MVKDEHEAPTVDLVGPHNHRIHALVDRADAIRHEVIRNRLVMIKVVGSAGSITNALRPPGENYTQAVADAIASAGHVTIVHTDDVYGFDSDMDPQQPAQNVHNFLTRNFDRLSDGDKKGAIGLLHNGRSETRIATASILDWFRDNYPGYSLEPLPANLVPPLR